MSPFTYPGISLHTFLSDRIEKALCIFSAKEKGSTMRSLSQPELKQYLIDILVAFDTFCKNNNLEYQLSCGTLLGAIRHQGFIPWDDDIDLLMPNDDYHRMIDILNEADAGGMIDERYRLADIAIKTDIPYHQTFGKIYDTHTTCLKSTLRKGLNIPEGVFIDIFRIDGMPKRKSARDKLLKKAEFYNNMAYYASRQPVRKDFSFRDPKSLLSTAANYAKAATHPFAYWVKKYDDLLRTCPSAKKARQAFDVKNYLMEKKTCYFDGNPWFPTELATFEGKEFPVPKNYDEILRTYYSDYRQLPPEENRHPSHDQTYLLLD